MGWLLDAAELPEPPATCCGVAYPAAYNYLDWPRGAQGVRHDHGLIGGSDARDGCGRSAGVFDPTSGMFAAVSAMNAERFRLPHAVVLLRSGDVLVAGGATDSASVPGAWGRTSPSPRRLSSRHLPLLKQAPRATSQSRTPPGFAM